MNTNSSVWSLALSPNFGETPCHRRQPVDAVLGATCSRSHKRWPAERKKRHSHGSVPLEELVEIVRSTDVRPSSGPNSKSQRRRRMTYIAEASPMPESTIAGGSGTATTETLYDERFGLGVVHPTDGRFLLVLVNV